MATRICETTAISALVILAAFLRLFDLANASLWFDEAYSSLAKSLSFRTIVTVPFDVHPPLYYAFAKLIDFPGSVEVEMRAPSAIAGIASVALVWVAGRGAFGLAGGLASAAFLAVNTLQIDFSQEARPYALLFLLLTGVTLAVLRLVAAAPDGVTGVTRLVAAVYSISAILALYTHVVAAIFLAAVNLPVVLIMAMELRRTGWARPLQWGALNLACLVVWLPYAVVIPATSGDFSWLEQPAPRQALGIWLRSIGVTGMNDALTLLTGVIVLSGLAVLWLRGRRNTALVLGAIALAFPALVWGVGTVKPIMMDRTLLPATIGASLLFGGLASAAAEARRWRWLLVPLCAVITLNVWSTVTGAGKREREDWRAMAATLIALDEQGRPVLLCRHGYVALLPYTGGALPFVVWWPEHEIFTGIDEASMLKLLARSPVPRTQLSASDLSMRLPESPVGNPLSSTDEILVVPTRCDRVARETLYTRLDAADFAQTLRQDHGGVRVEAFRRSR